MRFFNRLSGKTARNVLSVLFISAGLYALIHAYPSIAESANPAKELSIVKEKIQKEKQKIEEAIRKEQSILSELEKIDKSVKNKKGELSRYDDRLRQTTKKIQLLQKDISKLTDKIGDRKRLLRDRLRFLYKDQYSGDTALVLISSQNYQELMTRSRYLSLLAHYDQSLMDTYSREIGAYTLKRKEMEMLQDELESSKSKIQTNMKEMTRERIEKDKILADIKSKRDTYEKMVKELHDSSVKLKKMIDDLEKQKALPTVSGEEFSVMKGGVPWPVYGKVLVPFGKYKDPQFNIPVFKNGIEIKANEGDTVRSVHTGRVVYADWFKGYGLLLILNHGDGYHSLYGNLAEIFYKTGDIIKRGASVGTVAEKGMLNVPTLYFEIRHKGKPIDPLGWLQRSSQEKKKIATKEKRQIKPKIQK